MGTRADAAMGEGSGWNFIPWPCSSVKSIMGTASAKTTANTVRTEKKPSQHVYYSLIWSHAENPTYHKLHMRKSKDEREKANDGLAIGLEWWDRGDSLLVPRCARCYSSRSSKLFSPPGKTSWEEETRGFLHAVGLQSTDHHEDVGWILGES